MAKFKLCLMIDEKGIVKTDNAKIIEAKDLDEAIGKYAELVGIKYPWDEDSLYDGVFINGNFTTIIQTP